MTRRPLRIEFVVPSVDVGGMEVLVGSMARALTARGHTVGVTCIEHEGALASDLRASGIRVSLVSPGPVNTDLWNPVDPDRKEGFTPRAAMLTPEAVADAVHYVVTAPAELNVDELRLSRS